MLSVTYSCLLVLTKRVIIWGLAFSIIVATIWYSIAALMFFSFYIFLLCRIVVIISEGSLEIAACISVETVRLSYFFKFFYIKICKPWNFIFFRLYFEYFVKVVNAVFFFFFLNCLFMCVWFVFYTFILCFLVLLSIVFYLEIPIIVYLCFVCVICDLLYAGVFTFLVPPPAQVVGSLHYLLFYLL